VERETIYVDSSAFLRGFFKEPPQSGLPTHQKVTNALDKAAIKYSCKELFWLEVERAVRRTAAGAHGAVVVDPKKLFKKYAIFRSKHKDYGYAFVNLDVDREDLLERYKKLKPKEFEKFLSNLKDNDIFKRARQWDSQDCKCKTGDGCISKYLESMDAIHLAAFAVIRETHPKLLMLTFDKDLKKATRVVFGEDALHSLCFGLVERKTK
jgi:predicted nucleic acid-binding protein